MYVYLITSSNPLFFPAFSAVSYYPSQLVHPLMASHISHPHPSIRLSKGRDAEPSVYDGHISCPHPSISSAKVKLNTREEFSRVKPFVVTEPSIQEREREIVALSSLHVIDTRKCVGYVLYRASSLFYRFVCKRMNCLNMLQPFNGQQP